MAEWLIWNHQNFGIYATQGRARVSTTEIHTRCSKCGEEVEPLLSNFLKECPNCHEKITGRVHMKDGLILKDDSDKWEYDDDLLSPMYGLYRCPACGSYSGWPSKFCPECGKKKKV